MKNLFFANNAAEAVSLLTEYGYCQYLPNARYLSLLSLAPLMKTFIELTNLSPEERKEWEIDVEGNKDPDDGLIERNGGLYDHKFFFHYKDMGRIIPFMENKESYKQNRNKWDYFLGILDDMHSSLSEDMYNLISTFNDMYPQHKIMKKVAKQNHPMRGVLRLLYYKPGYKVVAQPHYDQSLFTFHIADSHPGLIVGKENEKTREVYVQDENTILVFPGMKAELVTDGLIPAAYHVAVGDNITLTQGRWAIVFFYHCDIGISSQKISKMIKQKISSIS